MTAHDKHRKLSDRSPSPSLPLCIKGGRRRVMEESLTFRSLAHLMSLSRLSFFVVCSCSHSRERDDNDNDITHTRAAEAALSFLETIDTSLSSSSLLLVSSRSRRQPRNCCTPAPGRRRCKRDSPASAVEVLFNVWRMGSDTRSDVNSRPASADDATHADANKLFPFFSR